MGIFLGFVLILEVEGSKPSYTTEGGGYNHQNTINSHCLLSLRFYFTKNKVSRLCSRFSRSGAILKISTKSGKDLKVSIENLKDFGPKSIKIFVRILQDFGWKSYSNFSFEISIRITKISVKSLNFRAKSRIFLPKTRTFLSKFRIIRWKSQTYWSK